jgi:MFS family permease
VLHTGRRHHALAFFAVAASAGVVITFLPSTTIGATTAATALLLYSLAATLARVAAGRHGDRHGHLPWLVAGSAVTAAGLLLLAAGATSMTLLLAVTVCGAGFGAAQSSSLTLMMEDAETAELPTISAAWNVAYDVGLGAGPLAFAVASAHTSVPWALSLLGLSICAGLLPAASGHGRRRTTSTRSSRRARNEPVRASEDVASVWRTR